MAMTVEEALEIAQSVLEQGHLSKVQEIVFQQSWEDSLTDCQQLCYKLVM